MKNLTAAIVGIGFVGRAHADALRRLGISIRGVLESSAELGQAVAESLDIPIVYSSINDLVNDGEVDVIHVCTPNYLHAKFVQATLEAGKHVMCEKPLAINSQEASTLVNLANQHNRVGAVCYNLRYYPLCQQMHVMVKAGEIGEPSIVHGSYLQDWLLYPTDWNWRLNPDLGGSPRAVADIGTHWLDLASWVTGRRVTAVCADLVTVVPTRHKPLKELETFAGKIQVEEGYKEIPIHTEDYASILLHFEDNLHGVMTVSQVSPGRKNRLWIEVDGSEGSLCWDSETPNSLWIGSRQQPNGIIIKDPSLMRVEARSSAGYPGGHAEGYPDTFLQLFKAFYTYIATGNFQASRPFPTFETGYEELRLCEAITASAQEKCWNHLD